jgi:hypothetical protein
MIALRPQREQFCHEYLATNCNGAEAYRRAGFKVNSRAAAESGASRLLRDAKVLDRIHELQRAALERADVDAEWVIRRLREEADYRGPGSSHGARVRALVALLGHVGALPPQGQAQPQGPPMKSVDTAVEETERALLALAREVARRSVTGTVDAAKDGAPTPAVVEALPPGGAGEAGTP